MFRMPKSTIQPERAMYLLGPDWHTKIEHDGYHLFVRRDGKRVRLFNERVRFYAFDCPCSP